MGDAEQKPWRDALVQRLLLPVVVLGSVALTVVMVGGTSRIRALDSVLLALLGLLAILTRKRGWPYRVRAGGLVCFFAVATFIAYGTVGFLGNSALIGGGCVI